MDETGASAYELHGSRYRFGRLYLLRKLLGDCPATVASASANVPTPFMIKAPGEGATAGGNFVALFCAHTQPRNTSKRKFALGHSTRSVSRA